MDQHTRSIFKIIKHNLYWGAMLTVLLGVASIMPYLLDLMMGLLRGDVGVVVGYSMRVFEVTLGYVVCILSLFFAVSPILIPAIIIFAIYRKYVER